MFERFSKSYYLGRLYVTPGAGDRVTMDHAQHERVNEQLYATGEGAERLDTPVVMKLEGQHFPVHGSESVPTNTLSVPADLLENTDIENPPELASVLLANRDRARQLLEYAGWNPDQPIDEDNAVDDGVDWDGPVGT
ncbi:DUF5802 family protein [Halovivax limisalsi]|uniref:DUF5802 family protein n=1 Tax=Halovivax limisalsi TaxID=1453760 RepID=UPI001FFC7A9D|nr:DUF5802 family protein [Halovivax limisalsi]